MPLTAAAASEYFRQSGQQQTLYAYWLAAGDVARARLAMDVANWYYQQLSIPLYQPTDLIGYVPSPTTPDAALTIAASLPFVSDIAAAAAADPAGSSGSGSGSGSSGLHPHFDTSFLGGSTTALSSYCAYYPDDPICYAQGFGGYGSSGGGNGPIYIDQPVTIIINQQGLTLADVASKISGALATAAAGIAGATNAAIGSAIAGIQHALNAIGNALVGVFHLLARLIGLVLQFLKTLLLQLVKGLVAAVHAIGEAIKGVLQHGLLPALQALQRLRDYLIKIYERFLRPLLIILQDIRKVLAILKAFHIGFAEKLDAVLADIQAKVSGPLLYLLQFTNAIANYINLILDARLYIQRPLFLASANANKGSLLNLLINAMNPKPNAAAIAALKAEGSIPKPTQSSAALKEYLATGTGPFAGSINVQRFAAKYYIENGLE